MQASAHSEDRRPSVAVSSLNGCAEAKSSEVLGAFVGGVAAVALHLQGPDVRGPRNCGNEDVPLRAFDVHLHVIGRSRLGEQVVQEQRVDFAAIEGDSEARFVPSLTLDADHQTLRPDGRADHLTAVGPGLSVPTSESCVRRVEFDTDDVRGREGVRQVGHRQADVRAEIPDQARLDRSGQMGSVVEDVEERCGVRGSAPKRDGLTAQRLDADDLLAGDRGEQACEARQIREAAELWQGLRLSRKIAEGHAASLDDAPRRVYETRRATVERCYSLERAAPKVVAELSAAGRRR